MEIKRIKKIQNIGTFRNLNNSSSPPFERINFIYGQNTFGKTTLTDIFQSLKDNNIELIRLRESIPSIEEVQQLVHLSIKNNNENNESNLEFQNNVWTNSEVANNLEIFGTDFIHKNLFTGLEVERKNKENLTRFIIGDSGSKIAKKIADGKKKLGQQKSNLRSIVPAYTQNKNNEDINKFLDYDVSNLNKEEIKKDLTDKNKLKQNEEERLKNPQKITKLANISDYKIPDNKILVYLENINDSLQKDYSNIQDEVLKKIENHISRNFINKDYAEDWIRQGFNNCNDKDDSCIFCGQNLTNARTLIDSYNNYFDEEYDKFIEQIESVLNLNFEKIQQYAFNETNRLNGIIQLANKFKEFNKDKKFQNQLSDLETNISYLQDKEKILSNSKISIVSEVGQLIGKKNKKPHAKLLAVNYNDFKKDIDNYQALLVEIKTLISNIQTNISDFKSQYKNTETIQEKISNLTKEISKLEYQQARIQQNKDCEDYKEHQKQILILEKNIKNQERGLKADQNQYLQSYFDEINKLFKFFGSENFSLIKQENNQGHMPVYSLQVRFNNKNIPSDKLKVVFSESDRRALALSIFWAKINLKSEEEKSNLIVILDDPVTSFDDNRISNTISLLKKSINQLSQIFVFTHYPNFIKNFCERVKEAEITTKFFELDKNQDTSLLQTKDRKEFTKNQYEKTFLKIYEFINREHNDDIKTDLRKFLENLYLPTVFAHKIKKYGVDASSLENMIDGIFDKDEDEIIKNKFHEYRKKLNPDHHLYTSDNGNEDLRNFAKDMMEFLYSFSFNNGTDI